MENALEDTSQEQFEIKNFVSKLINNQTKNESDELNELFSALAKAQAEIEIAKTDNINPSFKSKYADLASVVKASRKYLAKNNLSIIQRILTNRNGSTSLFTRLCHSSGQWIESKMPINPPENDIQSIGSYITYLRRYNYASLIGIATSDEDDDGERAMEQNRKIKQRSSELINKQELNLLSKELNGNINALNSIFKTYKIEKLADLKKSDFIRIYERIKKVKNAS